MIQIVLSGVNLVLPEYLVFIKIEKLEEGVYLATSDNLQGLVAQGRTIAETMEIAQDVARKLIESYIEYGDPLPEELMPPARVLRNIKIPVAVTV
ncbi:MAG: type II toxin-antitoxin system HicB family antitoxin [Methanothrix sp.]|nr:type II toxin-antitoxin system HicB family antitoxin [Methanothrix sp.]